MDTLVVDRYKHVCWINTAWTIHRYLMSNADGRWDGAEKALRHRELCQFYVAAVRGQEPDAVQSVDNPDYTAVHDATAEGLTDRLDEVIGFPITGRPDYDSLAPKFFEQFHALAMSALCA